MPRLRPINVSGRGRHPATVPTPSYAEVPSSPNVSGLLPQGRCDPSGHEGRTTPPELTRSLPAGPGRVVLLPIPRRRAGADISEIHADDLSCLSPRRARAATMHTDEGRAGLARPGRERPRSRCAVPRPRDRGRASRPKARSSPPRRRTSAHVTTSPASAARGPADVRPGREAVGTQPARGSSSTRRRSASPPHRGATNAPHRPSRLRPRAAGPRAR